MRRISVFSTAGGSGKTTTVVNLAAALCERGHRALVVDLAPGARVERAFGRARRRDLLEAVEAGAPLTSLVRPTAFAGLFVLGAGLDIDGEERLRRGGRALEQRMIAAFDALFREAYDFVLFDCGTAVQRFVTLALSLCDEHIAPIEAAPLSIAALPETLSFADAVREARNPGLSASRILVSRYFDEDAAAQAVAGLHERYPGLPFDLPVPHSRAVVEAASRCEPVLTYRRDDPATTAYRRIAQEILATARARPLETTPAHV